jgi:hypothetical protein
VGQVAAAPRAPFETLAAAVPGSGPTVGRLLAGTKTWIKWRKPGVKLSSPQLVIAIFDGNRAMVVTDCWPFGTSRSEWANPFMAGVPIRVEYFTE